MNLQEVKELLAPILPNHANSDKPHKAIAILAVVDGIFSDIYIENKIFFDSEFKNLFTKYFKKYDRSQDRNRPLAPFFHLRSSSIWNLKSIEGKIEELKNTTTVGSPKDLFNLVEYAYLDQKFHDYLLSDKNLCTRVIFIISEALKPYSLAKKARALEIPSKFPHEQQALEAIIPPLEKQVEFVSNFELYDAGSNDYLECDLIAVCSSCITIIELKHWGGEIEILPNNWQVNSRFRNDPHRGNNYKCKVLKGYLEKKFPYIKLPWVESIVVLTNPDATVYNYTLPKKAKKNPTFASTDHLITYLRYKISTSEKQLEVQERKKIANDLWAQTDGPRKKKFEIPGYEIRENLTQSSDRMELLARVKGLELQKIRRLRVFLPDLTLPAEEREIQRTRAQTTLRTLEQVGKHPNIISVEPVPNDDNLVIEVSDWSDEGTLADVMHRRGKLPIQESLRIVSGIICGLSVLHDNAVVHRDLRPENIMMDRETPLLMNFDYTYIPDDHTPSYTVFPDPDTLNASPFLAPELYTHGQFSESTDLFSVGVILYSLLCGEPPFSNSLNLVDQEENLSKENINKLRKAEADDSIVSFIISLLHVDHNKRPQDAFAIIAIIKGLLGDKKDSIEEEVANNSSLTPGESHDVYEIEQLIGTGREAQVYLARKYEGQKIALKVFFNEVSRDRIFNEERHLSMVNSPFLLHAHGIHKWKGGRFFLETKYVEGSSLRALIKENDLPDINRFKHVASCLMEAVKVMHLDPNRDKPLLHNDIKPDNILITEDGDPVLIDFGAACFPHIGLHRGTPHYIAPDLQRKIDFEFCENGDLFALGVTLFEWLCGSRPYNGVPAIGDLPKSSKPLSDDIPKSITDWLDQSVQPSSDDRFEDILTMSQAFESCFTETSEKKDYPDDEIEVIPISVIPTDIVPKEPVGNIISTKINTFVSYLNTLHSATAADDGALAETQARSDHFGQIHVSLPQTDYIFKQLTQSERCHVLLTGHAGDGKSTIGLELYKKLKDYPRKAPLANPLKDKEVIDYKGLSIHIVKDMSELSVSDKDRILTEALSQDNSDRYFIITNSGTLLSTFERVAEQQGHVPFKYENTLLNSLGDVNPCTLELSGVEFSIINLAQTDNVKTAISVLERIVEHDGWEPCLSCDTESSCPIFQNVSILKSKKFFVFDRISFVYRKLKEYGSRLTMRQLTGHIAYSLTSGLDCKTIHDFKVSPKPPKIDSFLFSNRFFGYTASGIDERCLRMAAIQKIHQYNLGSKPYPQIDRSLWSQEVSTLPNLSGHIEQLVITLKDRADTKKQETGVTEVRQLRQSIRRIYYLFSEIPKKSSSFIPNFLDSQMLVESEEWQQSSGPQSMRRKNLLRKILHVLQEEYTGFRLGDNHQENNLYITLRRKGDGYRQSVQLLLAQIPLSNFDVNWKPINTTFLPQRSILVLFDKVSGHELQLDLPFLDYVLMRDMGEIGQKINPGYRDRLEHFKTQLFEFSDYSKKDQLVLLEMERNGQLKTRSLEIHEHQLQVI